jgi:uncharacterized protein YciI
MKNEPEKIRKIVAEHVRYWKDSKPINYSGGPVSDRSGGLILFEAVNIETATELATNDLIVIREAIETKLVKEWIRK